MTAAPLDKPMPLVRSRLSHNVVYWTGFCVVMALLIVAPMVLPEFWRRFLTEILIWGLLARRRRGRGTFCRVFFYASARYLFRDHNADFQPDLLRHHLHMDAGHRRGEWSDLLPAALHHSLRL